MHRILLSTIVLYFVVLSASHAVPDMDPTSHVILLGLDKMTGRTHEMHVPVGQPHQFGTLTIVPQRCFMAKPEDPPESIAYLDIYEASPQSQKKGLESSAPKSTSAAIETDNAQYAHPEEDGATGQAEQHENLSAGSARAAEEEKPFAPHPDMQKRFSNWMFASSPAVSPFDHPVYDVWVKSCAQTPTEETADA